MATPEDVRRPGGLVDRLTAAPGRSERLTHLEVLPARSARPTDWPPWLATEVRQGLAEQGIDRPWTHQRATADLAHAGRHVVVATGTASGKSLGYWMPALSDILAARHTGGRRGATVLYLSPTKALANDQLAALERLAVPGLHAATHDGDSSRDQRDVARDFAEYLLTNPDMLHRSMLSGHRRWARFFSMLRYVVVDECHHYRGVFGAHVALVLRRLRRVCAHYGAEPTFVLSSATVADPADFAARLTGLETAEVLDDGSPRGRVELVLWEPPLSAGGGEHGAPARRSAAAETADLLVDLVLERVHTLAFVRSRRGAEYVALQARTLLEEVAPGLGSRVATYRGGYLPEDRRELEAALREGRLLGLAATNALELGIDISGLDAVLLAGFPGTRAALWQQVGRAGRGAAPALGVLVARDDPLDTYLVTHPEALLGPAVEASVFDPENPYVLGPHLCAAAEELPLTVDDLPLFGRGAAQAVDALAAAGLLRRRARGWYWTDRRRAADLADIRSAGGAPVRLVEEGTGRVVGTVDAASSHGTVHPGAVYVHRGDTWLVATLDLGEHVATMTRADLDYSTSARDLTDVHVVAEDRARSWGPARLSLGRVRVTSQVVSFLLRKQPSGEVLGEEPLDLPERVLETTAVWWTLPADVLAASPLSEADLPGAAHAAEHAAIGLLPLFATCDRWDIGGLSTAAHPDTGTLTVFVHDGHPGGAGFAERGYAQAEHWLRATREAIVSCRCETGCPSCVQSPKCGNGNEPLDKAGAVTLLDLLLEQAPRSTR